MKQTFEEYLKKEREYFTKITEKYSVEEHLELRTAVDSLLIAYDQAIKQALTTPDTVENLKRVLKEKYGWDNLDTEHFKWFINELLKDVIEEIRQQCNIANAVEQSEQLCQCDDAPIKHFIKNWCDDCEKRIV